MTPYLRYSFRDRKAAVDHLLFHQAGDGVQEHYAVSGQDVVGEREEVVVAGRAEVLERADRHDAADGLVELFPSIEQNPPAGRAIRLVEGLLHVGGLVLRQTSGRLRPRPT